MHISGLDLDRSGPGTPLDNPSLDTINWVAAVIGMRISTSIYSTPCCDQRVRGRARIINLEERYLFSEQGMREHFGEDWESRILSVALY